MNQTQARERARQYREVGVTAVAKPSKSGWDESIEDDWHVWLETKRKDKRQRAFYEEHDVRVYDLYDLLGRPPVEAAQ